LRPGDERIFVVSPHLDDGVLSCGQRLAASPGSIVLTVFAGSPPTDQPITEWDRASGFEPGTDPMAARREEDRRALAVLGAEPIWLGFLDAQYGDPPSIESVASQIEAVVAQADCDRVFIPLGLFHSDHELTHLACLRVAGDHPQTEWVAYAEATYRTIPGLVDERLGQLRASGIEAIHSCRTLAPACLAQKRTAVACYESQLRALSTPGRPGYAAAFEAEPYWRLEWSRR